MLKDSIQNQLMFGKGKLHLKMKTRIRRVTVHGYG